MIDSLEIDPIMKASMLKAFERRLELSGNNIHFFNEPFAPISLTGTQCSLQCKHCNSYYLNHMKDGSPGKLYSHAIHLASVGANGILLSGGSAPDGSVPTYDQADIIKKIKLDTNLKISAHTGIVNRMQTQVLSQYLNMALVDVIGDDETIHDILGLDASAMDYENSLKELSAAGIPLAPHIIVGLHYGDLKGEFRALEMVRKFDPQVVVIVVFIPTKGTSMEGTVPPKLEDVVKVITKAREMFDVPLSLSCVRPGGRYRSMLDRYAILSGIDRIAVPSKSAYSSALELGLNVVEIPKMCCSYGV
jgi:lipoyl synthase